MYRQREYDMRLGEDKQTQKGRPKKKPKKKTQRQIIQKESKKHRSDVTLRALALCREQLRYCIRKKQGKVY